MKKSKTNLWAGLAVASLFMVHAALAQTTKSAAINGTGVRFPATNLHDVETQLNTVTTTGPDGVKYKLVQIGDLLPKLYVNNKLIATENLGDYQDLIAKLMPILWERQKVAASKTHVKTNSGEYQP